MVQESATEVSPSISTGTFSELCGAIASFSVKHQGIDSADSPLCASAIRVRQQNGLNGRCSVVPTSSNSFKGLVQTPLLGSHPCDRYRMKIVIARSESDEAIQSLPNKIMDCFASLAMTNVALPIPRHARACRGHPRLTF